MAAALVAQLAMPVAGLADDETDFQALEWRNIDPFNGGRGTSVVGHPTDPQVFYFGTAGPESGIYRSLDGGDTWEDISRNDGVPEGMMGRVGLTMSKADPNRVYALIDSESRQGLYRSDDLGKTWRFVSDYGQIIARPFYFYHIYANPNDADDLWAPANKLYHSPDGGETWVLEPGAKDDFQDIWIDPNDSNRMIVTCDGGTQVTLTGGKTWSRFDNQTGVQFYRVDTDDQFPYNLYGNAQDLLIYKAPSASRWGGIPLHMTEFVGNGETSRAIPHPTDPEIVYSLSTGAFYGMAAHFTINNLKTGQNEVRSIWPEALFGTPATEFKYRFNWQAPFLVSPHDPGTIYMAGNVVFRTRDEGMFVINPIAKPGNYQVRLTVDGQSQTQPFELKINPNEKYTLSETDEKGAFWMKLYAKAEEGVQAVLEARAATGQVAGAIEAARGGDQDTATLEALESQGAIVDQICTELETSMVSTGTTLIQIISEPSKPLAQLTMLHNIMETTEGPPNQALREVYTKIAGEMDASKAKFETALSREMARFDELTR